MQFNHPCKTVSPFIVSFFCFLSSSFTFLFLFFSPLLSQAQTGDSLSAIFILKGNTQVASGKSYPEANLELKQGGNSIAKLMSGRNGKFVIEMEISITNKNHEYQLIVSDEGMITKTLNINTYIPKDEFLEYDYDRYDFKLEVEMLEQPRNEKIIAKHTGTIQWSSTEGKFILKEVSSRISIKEKDEVISFNTISSTYTESVTSPAKTTIPPPTNEQANVVSPTNTGTADTNNKNISSKTTPSKQVEVMVDKANINIKKNSKANAKEGDEFDVAAIYSVNIEKHAYMARKKKINAEQAKNASTKYETINLLTSMLNVVDEQNKQNRPK